MERMNTYIVLLRGINVGGKNKVPMAALKTCLEDLGFRDISTYIASGNVLLRSEKTAAEVQAQIEAALPQCFTLHDELVRVLALTPAQLGAVVANKPPGFGEHPDTYHSDAIFLIGIDAAQAMTAFNPREGVDQVWPGEGVIYSQRLSAQLSRSRQSKIISSPLYKYMTIRSWNTTTKLLELAKQMGAGREVTPR
jgi:uncharacterized protein (DUF1697 family)